MSLIGSLYRSVFSFFVCMCMRISLSVRMCVFFSLCFLSACLCFLNVCVCMCVRACVCVRASKLWLMLCWFHEHSELEEHAVVKYVLQ